MGESPPNGYVKKGIIDLTSDQKMKFSAILFGLVLIIAVSILMVKYVAILRPGTLHLGITEDQEGRINISLNSEALLSCLAAFVFVLIFHELLHGVAFWRVSEEMPIVGLKGVFIYVSAPPNVYFQRNKYLWVGAAPIILLTLAGVLLVPILPPSLILLDVMIVTFNVAGSAGDLVMILMLLKYPSSSLIQDLGSGMVIYELHAP